MMEHNDELYLKQTVGNRNPFRVPDGYFEQLTKQVMQQLPDREPTAARQIDIAPQPVSQTRARKVSFRPWLYAAACSVVALAMGVSYYFMQSPDTPAETAPVAAVSSMETDYSFIDDAADYAMLDNAEIYACLSENY